MAPSDLGLLCSGLYVAVIPLLLQGSHSLEKSLNSIFP